MAVQIDNTSTNFAQFGATATGGTLSKVHLVNPYATGVTALLWAYVMANTSLASATVTATFGGQTMTMQGSPVLFGSNENMLVCFALPNAPTNLLQEWQITVTGLAANSEGFWIMGAGTSYGGVLGIGTPVPVTGDTAGASTSNSVTVVDPGPGEGYKVVTAHAVRTPNLFTNYNLTIRCVVSGALALVAYLLGLFDVTIRIDPLFGGELLVGDSPGASTVTGTCPQPSTAVYGALGLYLIPAPVVGKAALNIPSSVAVTGSLTRDAAPSPLRTWVIEPS